MLKVEKGTVRTISFCGVWQRVPAIRVNNAITIQTERIPASIDELVELFNSCPCNGSDFIAE